jgi:hypothetical protein
VFGLLRQGPGRTERQPSDNLGTYRNYAQFIIDFQRVPPHSTFDDYGTNAKLIRRQDVCWTPCGAQYTGTPLRPDTRVAVQLPSPSPKFTAHIKTTEAFGHLEPSGTHVLVVCSTLPSHQWAALGQPVDVVRCSCSRLAQGRCNTLVSGPVPICPTQLADAQKTRKCSTTS